LSRPNLFAISASFHGQQKTVLTAKDATRQSRNQVEMTRSKGAKGAKHKHGYRFETISNIQKSQSSKRLLRISQLGFDSSFLFRISIFGFRILFPWRLGAMTKCSA